MSFSRTKKKESCQHDEYCGFAETLCDTTDLQEHCQMKDAELGEMPLMEKIKERLERDKERNEI